MSAVNSGFRRPDRLTDVLAAVLREGVADSGLHGQHMDGVRGCFAAGASRDRFAINPQESRCFVGFVPGGERARAFDVGNESSLRVPRPYRRDPAAPDQAEVGGRDRTDSRQTPSQARRLAGFAAPPADARTADPAQAPRRPAHLHASWPSERKRRRTFARRSTCCTRCRWRRGRSLRACVAAGVLTLEQYEDTYSMLREVEDVVRER